MNRSQRRLENMKRWCCGVYIGPPLRVERKNVWLEAGGGVRSYDTTVAVWTPSSGVLWVGPTYSVTTTRHISLVARIIYQLYDEGRQPSRSKVLWDTPTKPDGDPWTEPHKVRFWPGHR